MLVHDFIYKILIMYLDCWFTIKCVWDGDLRDVLNSVSELFGSWNFAIAWMLSYSTITNNLRPIDIIGRKDGRKALLDVLSIIENGICESRNHN